MASDNRVNVNNQGKNVNTIGISNDAEMETSLKREKARTKSNFTRSRNKMLFLIEKHELPNRGEIEDACSRLDNAMDSAMDAMTSLSDLYMKNKDLENSKKVVLEMEKVEEEFAIAYEAARQCLDSQKQQSSETSETLSIDLLNRMDISDQLENSTEARQSASQESSMDRHYGASLYETSQKVALANYSATLSSSTPLQTDRTTNYSIETRENASVDETEQKKVNNRMPNKSANDIFMQNHQGTSRENSRFSHVVNESRMNAEAAPFEPTASNTVPSIGQDLRRQLKRVQIPVFSGDKRQYQSWKAAFLACIDSAPATGEYKLLQLRQYLSGEALKVIDSLGHSAAAYKAAKDRLERKFGGKRRQIALYLEELEQFRQIRPGNAKDIEEFADLLDIAMINLQEAGQHYELGDGSLYNKLQRKIPQAMLAHYHRWIFENNKEESVLALRSWIMQEAEFQTIASETVRGLTGKFADASNLPAARYGNQRTFFGETKGGRKSQKIFCLECRKQHGIWNCQEFIRRSVADRWNVAKRLQLCYRCLAQGHQGKSCPRSRACGQNGCTDLHHRLLHKPGPIEQKPLSLEMTELKRIGSHDMKNPSLDRCLTEGKEQTEPTTMLIQSQVRADFIGLRTVPVILINNGGRYLKINALLDDASTKTYLNADVAAELGLQGRTEKVTVNVLNGQAETFETKPVSVELKSVTGSVSMTVSAYTVNRVTGNMPVVDWNNNKKKWPHLRNIIFPSSPRRPIVDMLIGLDCADLLYAIEEVRGRPGDPIARLTPLGWTCIGNLGSDRQEVIHTNFACTYFVKNQSEIEVINTTLKQNWEIEDVSAPHETPIIRIEDQLAMKKVKNSLTYENKMYRVSIPWKMNKPALPDNYIMALSRLENTEKRLKRSPEVAHAYNQCFDHYIEKGYVTRVQDRSTSKWYLPHFPVLRPDKDTTKTRIVFDASAKYDGQSLNDIIHQGPKLQKDLFDVLLRFRRLPVAVVCDVAEMYLRIGIAPEDKPFHRFLWRGIDQNRQPDIYEFDRVVFGVNSSPFLAQFVLQHHAQKFMDKFPMAAATILKSTYMDDSMDSVLDEEQGRELHRQLSHLLSKAGMHARKWLSNCSEVLREIPLSDRKAEVDLDREYLPCAKTLGVWWFANQDVFTFKKKCTR